MTRQFLGAVSFDSIWPRKSGLPTRFGGYALMGTYGPPVLDADGSDSNVGSRLGAQLLLENKLADGFLTRDKDFVSYVHEYDVISGSGSKESASFASVPDQSSASDGAARLLHVVNSANTQVQIQTQVRDAGAWVDTTTGPGALITMATGQIQWMLQVDLSLSPPEVRVLKDGAVYTDWHIGGFLQEFAAAGMKGTSSPRGEEVKGGGSVVATDHSYFFTVQGDSVADITTDISDMRVLANYAIASSAGVWTPSTFCIPDTKDRGQTLTESDSGQADQLFVVNDQAVGATVEFVSVVFVGDDPAKVDAGLCKLGATTSTATLTLNSSPWKFHAYGNFQDKPGGTGWTLADFSQSLFGPRADAGTAGKIHYMIINTVGKDQARPLVCPALTPGVGLGSADAGMF